MVQFSSPLFEVSKRIMDEHIFTNIVFQGLHDKGEPKRLTFEL